jgi:cytochrome c oxidase subunit 2
MWKEFALLPERASTIAEKIDALYFSLVAFSVFFSVLVFLLIFYFAVRYRKRPAGEPAAAVHGHLRLEIVWTAIPFLIAVVLLVWGVDLYLVYARPPAEALPISVVAKQWMWKLQHPGGKQEINELHVPVGQPVKLTMATEDVIHSFFVPAFRVKQDVVPGRYTTLWFEATRVGEYRLFCAEYCGTLHSAMGGRVVVMEPADYQSWLSGGEPTESPVVAGARLFEQRRCKSCHQATSGQRGPALEGLLGSTVRLAGGDSVVADEDYLRESILTPNAKLVEGYRPLMPTFRGQLSEEGLLQLIAYIKSLSPPGESES